MAAAKTPLGCTGKEKGTPLGCTEMEKGTLLGCVKVLLCILLAFLRAGGASGSRMPPIIMSAYSMPPGSCGG